MGALNFIADTVITPRAHDLTGMRFGKIVVLSFAGYHEYGWEDGVIRKPAWLCRCDCGVEKIVRASNLQSRRVVSCGCHRNEISRRPRKHGLYNTRVYRIWQSMKNRCFLQNHPTYKDYGARGITVCERWLKFENFFADMGHPPEDHSIERLDNDGNYEPGNCVWATRAIQARNRRSNHIIEVNGLSLTIVDWAARIGASPSAIHDRIRRGWDMKRVVTEPVRRV